MHDGYYTSNKKSFENAELTHDTLGALVKRIAAEVLTTPPKVILYSKNLTNLCGKVDNNIHKVYLQVPLISKNMCDREKIDETCTRSSIVDHLTCFLDGVLWHGLQNQRVF